MKLEAQTLAKIKGRINEKVMKSCGTWIDWQYLLDAAALLAKCRYTLQYTYPYAYYMEPSNRKKLVRNAAFSIMPNSVACKDTKYIYFLGFYRSQKFFI